MPKDKELADHERAHTGKPGAKVDHSGGQKRYVLHTDAPDIHRDHAFPMYPAPKTVGKGSEWESKQQHPGGVTEYRHELGSSLYETNAGSYSEARKKIGAVRGKLTD